MVTKASNGTSNMRLIQDIRFILVAAYDTKDARDLFYFIFL